MKWVAEHTAHDPPNQFRYNAERAIWRWEHAQFYSQG